MKPVADTFYRGRRDVLLLQIDPARLRYQVIVEDLAGTGEEFPHLYGALNLDAVEQVGVLTPLPDGTFAAIDDAR